ncbi:beta-klotho-like [Erpetoichthys calabaricus]|uniref:Klotho beta n=1 Tax=Erpetoichthys calabaricus TaxID=27687 RepID=A0A8C4RR13_ERPCA|nr:beta-klotho-like [Erpetoichthys calabaricus]
MYLRKCFSVILLLYEGFVACEIGDGRNVWNKFSGSSLLNETQYFQANRFPKSFLWGVGTAAFQTEGALDWDGKGPSIWDHFIHSPDFRYNDASSKSYTLWDKDLEALKYLGVKFYHFSISWPRLFSDGIANVVNMNGLTYYNQLIDSLREEKIEPVVTLYHWDLPLALQLKYGGWKNESLIDIFNDYAAFCFQAFGNRVKYWLTIHNPYLIAWHGYETGIHAPGETADSSAVFKAAHNLIKAHAKVWHTYDRHFRHTQHGFVSLTLGSHWAEPKKGNLNDFTIESCHQSVQAVLGWFGKPVFGDGDYPTVIKQKIKHWMPSFTASEKKYIRGTADFFAFSFGPNNFRPASTFVKYGQPDSLSIRQALNWIKLEYNNPRILIAENGWFTNNNIKTEDTSSIFLIKWFLNEVLQAIIHDDVKVFAYTAWSLVDGYEWSYAYSIRRGLFYVDLDSKEKVRVPKTSAIFYKHIIQQHGLPSMEASFTSQFSCDFQWGVSDSVIQVQLTPSSPQFTDPNLYLWNAPRDGGLRKVNGVKLHTRASQCTDFNAVRNHIQMLSRLSVNHYKFALNWSLILPNGDLSVINKEAIYFYQCLIKEMIKRGIKPLVTLYHPTDHHTNMPAPLYQEGGWLNRSTVHAFRDYANLCFKEFGEHVGMWITVNEPNKLSQTYKINSNDTYIAAHNLILAHMMAWHLYDKHYRVYQNGLVSFALHADWAEPANPYLTSHVLAAERILLFELAWFMDPFFKTGDYPERMLDYLRLKNKHGLSQSAVPSFTGDENKAVKFSADFVALNHFTTHLVIHQRQNGSSYEHDRDSILRPDVTWPRSPKGLSVVPWGIRKLLNWIKTRYGNVPIYITANGVDDKSSHNDELRKFYIKNYIKEILVAKEHDQVNVRGYYGWKLQDRQNSHFGFFNSPFFESRAKLSSLFYSELITNRGVFSEATATKSCKEQEGQELTGCEACTFILKWKAFLFFGICLLITTTLLITVLFTYVRKRRKPH